MPYRKNPGAQYFTAVVNWAAKEGILKGSNAGGTMLVRPNDPVTRQELATMTIVSCRRRAST